MVTAIALSFEGLVEIEGEATRWPQDRFWRLGAGSARECGIGNSDFHDGLLQKSEFALLCRVWARGAGAWCGLGTTCGADTELDPGATGCAGQR
ncbi:hypothetical protein GCM10023334_123720 [Nonomuraea thailandensis]